MKRERENCQLIVRPLCRNGGQTTSNKLGLAKTKTKTKNKKQRQKTKIKIKNKDKAKERTVNIVEMVKTDQQQ